MFFRSTFTGLLYCANILEYWWLQLSVKNYIDYVWVQSKKHAPLLCWPIDPLVLLLSPFATLFLLGNFQQGLSRHKLSSVWLLSFKPLIWFFVQKLETMYNRASEKRGGVNINEKRQPSIWSLAILRLPVCFFQAYRSSKGDLFAAESGWPQIKQRKKAAKIAGLPLEK